MGISEESDIHAETKVWILQWCRALKPAHIDWKSASEPSDKYNCMGFCMGPVKGKLRWWQPWVVSDNVVLTPECYWPGSPKLDATGSSTEGDSLAEYVAAANTVGFEVCDEADLTDDFENIVFFFRNNSDRPFRHAAFRITRDVWKSKVGPHSDFEHPPDAFDDVEYWNPPGRICMRRPKEGHQTSSAAKPAS